VTLVVTVLSANTSLGDPITAAAAARAGLSRPAELEGQAMTAMDGPVPLLGHPVATAGGFQGPARLLSLALPALRALTGELALPPADEVGLFLALPHLDDATAAARLLDRLQKLTGLPVAAAVRQAFTGGHAAFGMAVQAAANAIARREVALGVVGAVDSLCDPAALSALLEQGRLKTPQNPVGLQPGEAATFLAVCADDEARRRRWPVLARIAGAGVARDPGDPQDPDVLPLGQGTLLALQSLVAGTGPLPPGGTFFVVDCNGEPRRAADWGQCQQRLTATMPGVLGESDWFPAGSFGDTGAASAALATQLVVRAFARGYAPRRCAVVLSSGDDGRRSAIRLTPAE
jgi:3-oxoacyl-[acyl-carrier-protein] synthase-1